MSATQISSKIGTLISKEVKNFHLLRVVWIACLVGILGCLALIHNGIFYFFLELRTQEDIIEKHGAHLGELSEKSNAFGNWLIQSQSFNQSYAGALLMVERYVYFRDIVAGIIQIVLYILVIMWMKKDEEADYTTVAGAKELKHTKIKFSLWLLAETMCILSFIIGIGMDYYFLHWATPTEAHEEGWVLFRNRMLIAIYPTGMLVLAIHCLRRIWKDNPVGTERGQVETA